MKKNVLLLSSFLVLSVLIFSCKKKETTPTTNTTTNTTVPTKAEYSLTYANDKYEWSGNTTGFSQDTVYMSLIYKDKSTGKYILSIANQKIVGTDTVEFGFQAGFNSIETADFSTTSTNKLAGFYFFNTGLNIFAASAVKVNFTNPSATPVVGNLYYGSIDGTVLTSPFDLNTSPSSVSSSKLTGTYSAVYVGEKDFSTK